MIEAAREKSERARHYVVHEDNWPVVELFLHLDTQWRMDDGRPNGLDLVAAQAAARALGLRWNRDTLGALKTMEAAALAAWADKYPRRNRAPRCPLM